MNKKIIIGCIGAAVIIVLATFTSVVGTNAEKTVEKKVSPLFTIRTRKAISNKIEDVKTRFIGERLFFLPFQLLLTKNDMLLRYNLQDKTQNGFTCPLTNCQCTSSCCTSGRTGCYYNNVVRDNIIQKDITFQGVTCLTQCGSTHQSHVPTCNPRSC